MTITMAVAAANDESFCAVIIILVIICIVGKILFDIRSSISLSLLSFDL